MWEGSNHCESTYCHLPTGYYLSTGSNKFSVKYGLGTPYSNPPPFTTAKFEFTRTTNVATTLTCKLDVSNVSDQSSLNPTFQLTVPVWNPAPTNFTATPICNYYTYQSVNLKNSGLTISWGVDGQNAGKYKIDMGPYRDWETDRKSVV